MNVAELCVWLNSRAYIQVAFTPFPPSCHNLISLSLYIYLYIIYNKLLLYKYLIFSLSTGTYVHAFVPVEPTRSVSASEAAVHAHLEAAHIRLPTSAGV
eukprot:COSAG05_NODE_8716_length_678_cov_0.651123_1_plen_98_part_10